LLKEQWIICVDNFYVDAEYFETFKDLTEAQNKYDELLELYKEEISENKVTIYFTKVEKST